MIFVKIGRASNYEHFFNISRFSCWVKLHPGMNLAFLSELHWVLCTIIPVASHWKPATTHQILSSFFQSEIETLWPVINTAMKNIGVIILFTLRQRSTEKEWINILSTTTCSRKDCCFKSSVVIWLLAIILIPNFSLSRVPYKSNILVYV